VRQYRRNAFAAGALLGAALVLGYSVAVDRQGSPAGGGPLPSAGAPAPVTPEPASFTVVASGDVLIHPALIEQARADSGTAIPDFAPLLAGVAPAVSAADLALCHLEVPLAEPAGPYAGYPNFNAPPQVAAALVRVGYDSFSTASNHTLDQGRSGVRRTLDVLDAAGLAHTGSARSAQAVGLLIFFPSFLLGAGGPPPNVMGSVVKTVAGPLPLTLLTNAVREPWLGLGAATGSLAALAGPLPARAATAQGWNEAAFAGKSLDEIVKALGGGAYTPTKAISWGATPDIAENGAAVQVSITSALPKTEAIAIDNDLRGTLRNFGLKVGVVGALKFEVRIRELVANLPDLAELVEPLLIVRRTLREQVGILHRRLLTVVRNDAARDAATGFTDRGQQL